MNNKNQGISFIVLIPAYNEELHIKKLIEDVKKYAKNILVIDDGSQDKTVDILKETRVNYLVHEKNAGKGASLVDGFKYLLGKDFDYILTMDADGQHAPEDIPAFISAAAQTDAGIVVGNRMSDTSAMPLDRYLTNRFTSWVISRMAHQKISDSQCGFRLISKKVLESVDIKTKNYDTESEILIKASRNGFKITEVPVKTIYGNEASDIHKIKDTIRFFKLVFNLKKKRT